MTSSSINAIKFSPQFDQHHHHHQPRIVTSASTSAAGMSHKNLHSRSSRASQNELTLPPIVETLVTKNPSSPSSDMNMFKKFNPVNDTNDPTNLNVNTTVWTLSPNGSENDVSPFKFNTVELSNVAQLRKNPTSSTLNSYDKSPSIQSKLTNTTNTNSSSKKRFNLSATSTRGSFHNNVSSSQIALNRQYTELNVKTPLTLRKNMSTAGNLTSLAATSQPQRPSAAPRAKENQPTGDQTRRSTSLHRQNSLVFVTSSKTNDENSQPPPPLVTPRTRQQTSQLRPKSSFNNQKTANQLNQSSKTQAPTGKQAPAKQQVTQPTATATTTMNSTSNGNLFESMEMSMEAGGQLDHETGLNQFTLVRIINWLQDIENCTNMMKPPSRLAWSNRSDKQLFNNDPTTANTKTTNTQLDLSNNHKHHASHQNGMSANEFYLSDYDSLDDQIIEYNRVVDKTFHIVHDES